MAIYYVDQTTGDDGDSGLTQALAWKTINKVNTSAFAAGDQILFKCGETWTETLTVPNSGAAGNPILFASYGTGAQPIIDCEDTRIIGITTNAKNYVTIRNFDVRAAKAGAGGCAIVTGSGSTDNIIEYCDVNNNANYGIGVVATGADNLRAIIRYNRIRDNGLVGASGVGSGIITVGTDATKRVENCLIEHNIIYNNGTDNHDHGIYDEGYATIMRYNEIYVNRGFGIKIENELGGSDCQAYYNILYTNVSAFLITHFSANPVNNVIYNNLCYANGTASPFVYGLQFTYGGGVPSGNAFCNNIVIGAAEPEARYYVLANTDLTGCTITNNCYYSTEAEHWRIGGANKSWAQWQALGHDAFSVNADPIFMAATDRRLRSNSPCHVGVPVGLAQDYRGRPIVGIPDMGAYQSARSIMKFRGRNYSGYAP